jgi:hypothetical protein
MANTCIDNRRHDRGHPYLRGRDAAQSGRCRAGNNGDIGSAAQYFASIKFRALGVPLACPWRALANAKQR